MKKILLLFLLLPSCATADNFADVIMPDEFGIGNSFLGGSYSGWGMSRRDDGSTDRWQDGGDLDGNITSAWFVWRLPSYSDREVSVRDFRENIIRDYNGYEEPANSIISVDVDPETGSKSYSFGAGFYGAMLTIITLLGFGVAKLKGILGGGGSSTDTTTLE